MDTRPNRSEPPSRTISLNPRYRLSTGGPLSRDLDFLVTSLTPKVEDVDLIAVIGHIAGPYAPLPPRTFFRDIRLEPPDAGDAQTLLFTPTDAPRLRAISRRLRHVSLENAAAELRELLMDTAAAHIPDRTAGITLSSGMDSASLAAALAANDADLVALTWSTPVESADETIWARSIARHLGVPLMEIPVDPATMLPSEGIETSRGTPLVNIFQGAWRQTASSLAAAGGTVMFTGFGGDHLFGGHVFPATDMLLSVRLGRLVRYLARVRRHHPNTRTTVRRELAVPLVRQHSSARWAGRQRPVPWLAGLHHEAWRRLQADAVGAGILPGRAERVERLTDGIVLQLVERLQSDVDSEGVTLVHPLFDQRLVDFAISLPSWMLFDGGLDKLILRHAMRGILPDEVIELEKITPGAVAVQALRARSAALLALTRRMRSAELGYVDEAVLSEHVEAFVRGDHDRMDFWNALTLEDWLRRWW